MAITYNSAHLKVDSDPNLITSLQGDQKQTIAYLDDGTNSPTLYYFDDTQDAGEKWVTFCNINSGVSSGPTLPTFDADLYCKGYEFVKLNEHLHILETYTSSGTAWVKAFDNHPGIGTSATLPTWSGTTHPIGYEYVVDDGAGTTENYISDGVTGWVFVSCCKPHPNLYGGFSLVTFDSAVHVKGSVFVIQYENGLTGNSYVSDGTEWVLVSEEITGPSEGTTLPSAGSPTTRPGTIFIKKDGSGNVLSSHISGSGSSYGSWLTLGEESNSDLSYSSTQTTNTIASSDGTDAVLTAASTTKAGLMTKAIFDEHVLNNAKVSNVAETVTSIGLSANILTYTDEDGVDTDIDLSLYLDDTNLARLTSGSLNSSTGIATFTRDDASTFTIDMSAFLDAITLNNTLTSTSTTEGLTAAQGKVLKDLIDALPTSDTVDMGDGFKIANSAGTDQFTVTENEEIRFEGSGATSVSFDATTQKVTISSTDNNTDTVYTHPTFNGDDFSLDTGALTGATVISDLDINVTTNTEGHVTDANGTVSTRTLTLSDLGFTGDTDATSGGKFVDGTDTDDAVYTTGNVGIGTTSPSAKLTVQTSGTEVEGISVKNAGNTSEIFKVIEDGSNNGYVDIRNSSNTTTIHLDSSTGDSYFNGGNVGIGTTNPGHLIDVQGTTDPSIRVRSTGTGSSDDALIRLQTGGSTASNYIFFGDNSDADAGWIRYRHSEDSMQFKVNAAERMRIDSTGNVGIGTDTPDARLEVSDSFPTLRLTNESTTSNIGDVVSTIEFYNTDTSGGYPAVGAAIKSINESTFGNANALGFFTNSDSATETEYMRIDSSGNVGIGMTDPSEKLEVYGNIKLGNGSQRNVIGPLNSNLGIFANPNGSDEGILFSTDNGTTTEMIILNGGNVGIGTTSPDSIFHISQGADSTATNLIIENTDTSILDTEDLAKIEFKSNDASTNGAGVAASIRAVAESAGTLYGLALNTKAGAAESEKVRITAYGKVGIGLVEPSDKLEVVGAISASSGSGFKLGNSNETAIGKWYSASGVNFLEGDATRSFQIGSATNGVNVRFDNVNNRVGIGTTSPGQSLTVGDSTSTGNSILVEGSNADNTYTVFEGKRKYPKLILNDTISGGSSFNLWNLGNTLRFGTSTSSAANAAWYTKSGVAGDVIFNGDVGIGTSSPGSNLEVDGSAEVNVQGDVMFFINDSTYNWGIGDMDAASGGAAIKNNGAEIEVYTDSNLAATFKDDGRIANVTDPTADQDVSTKKYVDDLVVAITTAASDEESDLATNTGIVTFRMPYAMTLTEVRASVNRAPTGSTLIVDINESGSTILSTKLSIDIGEKTSTTAATPAVISDTTLADDAQISIDLDQVGSTVPGKGLKVTLIGTRA